MYSGYESDLYNGYRNNLSLWKAKGISGYLKKNIWNLRDVESMLNFWTELEKKKTFLTAL